MPTGPVAPYVAALTVHPVKSFAGLPSSVVDVDRAGVRGDRRWMVVDARDGGTLTARRDPVMLSARATPQDDGAIVLAAPGLDPLHVAVPDGLPDRTTTLSRLDRATDAGDAAAAWCSELLAKDVRLVWLDDPARRGMSEKHGGTRDDPMALTDTGPVHVTTAASLRRLDEWAAQAHDDVVAQALAAGEPAPNPYRALDMRRFRPNLVVDGDLEAFEEDGWSRLVVGDLELRFADRCGRCVMTTIDPDSLVMGREPLRTLARHRRADGEVWFGIQMVPVRLGRVSVGDPVTVA
ncbi:MOSC N-terminal beta barrel domain-containing protein [Cellulomonas sp.]|uniref:MOSC domain-containing protein n=1 Tax=Cellulomonas sp. TaxID=40001 RepID=UPI001B27489C|nr:MOSC N-terminal beta barrel domain-containing protein [Cellulomonas sp.]MBO9553961.1 MOSC domain-containing protein [Cellulomonas sp.]